MKLLQDALKRTVKKFHNAFTGIHYGLKYDTSIIIQVVISMLVIGVCVWLRLSDVEWMFVGSAIAVVLIAEFLNSAIEDMCDLLVKKYDFHVKEIKDISAGAVLLAAIYAIFIAIMILKGRIL